MAIHRELGRAQRRAQGAQKLLGQRRARLGAQLQQAARAGACGTAGPRYVLAQNVGTAERPLWTFLSVGDAATGQLVFSGNRQPVEFSEAQALELAPELGLFQGSAVRLFAAAHAVIAGTTEQKGTHA